MRIVDTDNNTIMTFPDGAAFVKTQAISDQAEPLHEAEYDADGNLVREEKLVWLPTDYEDVLMLTRQTQEQQMDEDERSMVLNAIIDSVRIDEKPAEKVGFLLVRRYDPAAHAIVWEFVEDPDYDHDTPDGSYLKPFTFIAPMPVTEGMWYTDGEDVWECVQSGLAESFTAPWLDVIG